MPRSRMSRQAQTAKDLASPLSVCSASTASRRSRGRSSTFGRFTTLAVQYVDVHTATSPLPTTVFPPRPMQLAGTRHRSAAPIARGTSPLPIRIIVSF